MKHQLTITVETPDDFTPTETFLLGLRQLVEIALEFEGGGDIQITVAPAFTKVHERSEPADRKTLGLTELQQVAQSLGCRVTEDGRKGCYNFYDSRDAHAFCVSLREVADLLRVERITATGKA